MTSCHDGREVLVKDQAKFLEKYSEDIGRLKADFFFVYTETGRVADAIERIGVSYHVYRNAREFDEEFNQIVRAAESLLDDKDEALLRDVAHGRGPTNFDKVRLTATIALLNNRRYRNVEAQVVMPPEIKRFMIPRPEKEAVGETEGDE